MQRIYHIVFFSILLFFFFFFFQVPFPHCGGLEVDRGLEFGPVSILSIDYFRYKFFRATYTRADYLIYVENDTKQ